MSRLSNTYHTLLASFAMRETAGVGALPMIFETLDTFGHEQVVFCHNKDAGLKAIIAIHNTVLGPALGGTRMWPYKTEAEALNDVLRLSRGMTYKNAVAGLNLGGGKAVIIGDPGKAKSEALFPAFGTLQGLMAALQHKFGNEDVGKYSYAVQGAGHVGLEFIKLLREQNAKVFVTDINKDLVQRAVDEFGCTAVSLDEIYDVDADVYSPCALGGTISAETLPRLKCKIVCGAANNQLANDAMGVEIEKRGILYAPDYAVNAGGVMNVSLEIDGYNRERAMRMMRTIYYNVGRIFEIAHRDGIPTYKAADRMAEERIATIGRIKLPHMGNHA